MDFVVARGFPLPLASVFDATTWALGAAPTLLWGQPSGDGPSGDGTFADRGPADQRSWSGRVAVATSHTPVRVGQTMLAFDGHAFDHDLFLHHAVAHPEDVAGLLRRDLADLGGAFCLLTVSGEPQAPTITVATDPLGMYPIYLHRRPDGAYVVSNSAHAVAAVLAHAGAAPRRSFRPCLANLTFNGPTGGAFLYEGVERLPHGHRVSVEAGRLSVVRAQTFEYRPDEDSYRGCVEAACAQMQGAATRLFAQRPYDTIVMDLTGGADSRAILALMLAMGLRGQIGVRNIMHRPHPDAHVAAYLTERYELAVAETVVPQPGPPMAAAFEAFGVDAFLHGGARDGGAAYPSNHYIDDYIHLTGFYGGGLGGKTGAAMTLRGPVLRMSVPDRVDHLLARRRRIGQLDFVSDEGVETVRQGIIGFYEGLLAQGATPEHLEAEAYLAGRCRTHFGLATVHNNRLRIQPDLLGNPWLVRARRALPARLAAHNKVVFDIIRRFAGVELAFAPMAEKRWDRSLVDAADLPLWEEMIAVRRDTPSISARMERLLKPRFLPRTAPTGRRVPDLTVAPPGDIVYPADRTRRFSAAAVGWAIDTGARAHVGHLIDLDGVRARVDDGDWRPSNIVQASFFDKLLPGLLWMLGAETPSRIDRRVSIADLPAALDLDAMKTAAKSAEPAPAVATSEAATAARALSRTVRTGMLMVAGAAGRGIAVTVATLPDGTPVLALAASGEASDVAPGDAMLRLVGSAGDGAGLAGLRLTLTGRLAPFAEGEAAAALAERRFRGRFGTDAAASGRPALWRLEVATGRLADPAGEATPLCPADLRLVAADAVAVAEVEPWALQRLNGDHRDLLALIAMRLCHGGAGAWTVTGVDADGLDLAREDGLQVRRLVFATPVKDGPTLRAMLVRLAEEARAVPVAPARAAAPVR
jgi:hypothetical protein